MIKVNKSIIAERFSKAIATYPREANVQRQIAQKMIGLVGRHVSIPSPRTLEFGCGTGIYSRMLLQSLQPRHLLLNDLCQEVKSCYNDILNERVSFLPGDAEMIPFPYETELITSCSALQWFEHPEVFFRKCNEALSHHGYFAFSTFGKENLKEVRLLTGKGLPYRSLEELTASLSSHFRILHAEEEITPLSFKAPIEVLYHLKQTGVTGLTESITGNPEKASSRPWTRHDIRRFCEQYEQQFSREDSVTLTYHPIYIIAKKKEV